MPAMRLLKACGGRRVMSLSGTLSRTVPSWGRAHVLGRVAGGARHLSMLNDAARIDYVSSCNFADGDLPLPHAHLKAIGNTPLIALADQPGVFAKLEGHSPGDSLKDRTITSIVMSSFKEGRLRRRGDTLVLVTSGSAGVSLIKLHEALRSVEGLDLNVIVVMPQAYAHKQIPGQIISMESTEVFHGANELLAHNAATGTVENRCQVMLMDGAFIDILAETREIASRHGWQMLEQHTDANSVLGHQSTALELLRAVPGLTDVVCSTGTGATAAGLRRFLPEHVTVHSRPAESGGIDGLSNVRRYNNFCDAAKLANYDKCFFDKATAERYTADLVEYGIEAGPSSGACFWLAREVMLEHVGAGRTPGADAQVVFICADGRLAPTPAAPIRIARSPSRRVSDIATVTAPAREVQQQQSWPQQSGSQIDRCASRCAAELALRQVRQPFMLPLGQAQQQGQQLRAQHWDAQQ